MGGVLEEGTMDGKKSRGLSAFRFHIIISSDRVTIVKLGFNLFSRSSLFHRYVSS